MCPTQWWSVLVFPLISARLQLQGLGRDYVTYSTKPGAPVRAFAYRPGVVALVGEQADKGILVQLQKLESFEQTSPLTVKETPYPHKYRVDGCFERNGWSHLLAYDTELNETLLIRGQEEVFLPLRDYTLLRYDYEEDTVYILRDQSLLRYPFEALLTYNDIGDPQERPTLKEKLDVAFTDLQVIGGQRFAIFDQAVHVWNLNGSWSYVTPTKADYFWFQLFPIEHSSTSLGEISPTSIVFIVEILVLLFAVYCLKMKLRLSPKTGLYEISRGSPPVLKA